MKLPSPVRSYLAVVVALALIPSPAAFGASTPFTQDPGWPRQVVKDGATLIYYQPQVDEWKDYKNVSARVAFSLTPSAGKQTMGVASVTANTLVDKESRTVYFRDPQFISVRFPGLNDTDAKPMEELFRKLAPTGGEPVSLDRLLADLDRGKVAATPAPIRNDPPEVFFSTVPAILLLIEGEPVLVPIEKTELEFVVNANWDVFFEKDDKEYHLMADRIWLSSKDLKGPWMRTKKLPGDLSKLPSGQNWNNVIATVPATSAGTTPDVFFSNKPAELLLFTGAPIYSRIIGTKLLYVANTNNDIFLDSTDDMFYILLSGRWFKGKDLKGPWTFASDMLPDDFKKIPRTSAKMRVLASVPGTIEASDAVMLAQIPTTAILNKADVEAKVKVNYDGDPKFAPIEGTSLEYATNTQDKVIQVGDEYYVCYNAVWLLSKNPNGPWKVADTIPKGIYSIPPSSPVYNITYVTQTTTVDTVESSTTAGYMGTFILGAAVGTCIAFGTGYYYPPYYYLGPAMAYPIYRPYPMTYGVAAVYNPWSAGFAVGYAAYGPYGAAGGAAWYNPATGRYGRSASVQGWYGGRTVASSYNPWTGRYGVTSQSHNAYAQWGQSAAVRGDQWARTGHISTANGTLSGYRTSAGNEGVAYHGQNGTLARGNNYTYAGNDGNVYRKDSNGSWSQYDKGSWNSVDTPNTRDRASQNLSGATRQTPQRQIDSQTMHGLDQSWQSRERGTAQTHMFQNFRGGGGRFRR